MKYSCEYCGGQYTKLEQVKSCETSCKKELARSNAEFDERDEFRNYIRLNLADIHDLPDMAHEHYKKIGCEVVFTRTPTRFTLEVSNTHDCPIGGVTNFSREQGKPTGYPGWLGWWAGTCKQNKKKGFFREESFISSFLEHSFAGFHSGSGGGNGDYGFGYSGHLYLQDFPKLTALTKKLSAMKTQQYKHLADQKKCDMKFHAHMEQYLESNSEHAELLGQISDLEQHLYNARGRFGKLVAELKQECTEKYGDKRFSKVKYDEQGIRELARMLGHECG